MPEYLAPGVYVEEVSSGIKPIEGVSTSTAALLGPTERGPEAANMVTSFAEFQRWYGGFLPVEQTFMPHAVKGFFDNGGKRAFIARIVHPDAAPSQVALDALTLRAIGRGAWGDRVRVLPRPGTKSTAQRPMFRITIAYYAALPDPFINPLAARDQLQPGDRLRQPDKLEDFDNVSVEPGAQNNVATILNASSQLVRVVKPYPTAIPGGLVAEVDAHTRDLAWTPLANGADGGAVDNTHYAGSLDPNPVWGDDQPLGRGEGLAAIDSVDEVSLLIAPDDVKFGDNLRNDIVTSCEKLHDRFAIVAVNEGEQNGLVQSLQPWRDSTFAALYHPWIYVINPLTNEPVRIPVAGHVAGVYARTDIERGVHKAPANEVVRGALGLCVPVNKGFQDILNPRGVDCLRDFRSNGRGIRVWGARTVSSDPEWKYVNVRRLFLFIEESIDEGTQWVVFEPNDDSTWAKVRRNVTGFLISVWRSGALMGLTQDEAFFVKCDRETMTQGDIDNGRLICLIGVAPVKPAEFVIFRIMQKTALAET
jgi:phage tail sheath protein FI